MTGYEEFQQIMAEMKRKIAINESVSNVEGNKMFNDIFGGIFK